MDEENIEEHAIRYIGHSILRTSHDEVPGLPPHTRTLIVARLAPMLLLPRSPYRPSHRNSKSRVRFVLSEKAKSLKRVVDCRPMAESPWIACVDGKPGEAEDSGSLFC